MVHGKSDDAGGFTLYRVPCTMRLYFFSRMLKKTLLAGCSKTLRYKAPEIPRSETYMKVRRNDEG
jgi:hypothetical protein